MKKKYLLLAGGLLFSFLLDAQENFRCGHTEAMNAVYAEHPEIKARQEALNDKLELLDKEAYKQGYKNGYPSGNQNKQGGNEPQPSGINGTVYLIPVVFHVLHLNGYEKIDETQLKDALKILNRDYRKVNLDTNQVIPVFKPLIGDAEIEFHLATLDPNGNCTNGMIYHYDSKTNWKQGNSSYYSYSGTGAGKWDPRKYLNIYVVKSITSVSGTSGVAGYTYLPGTWPAGSSADGIVILNDYIGSIGTGKPGNSRALTHEIGHWLNLPHTWGSTNSAGVSCGDDGVSDTPVTKGFSSCPGSIALAQTCTPNVTENYQNYMDYSYCSFMFTQGQVTRMRNAITSSTGGRSNLWGTANLAATGVSSPGICVPMADFYGDNTFICTGQSVNYKDDSQNAQPTAWSWSFPGGTPATSAVAAPKITYNTPGIYAVTYTATTSAGSNTVTKSSYVYVSGATAAYQNQFIEGFETTTLPSTDWKIINPAGVTWTRTNSAAATGTYSAKLDNTTNTPRSYDELISPTIDLKSIAAGSATGVPYFTFKVAHQQISSTQKDKLQVLSSTNCGQTWLTRYTKTGASLSTAGVSSAPFTPTATQWRTETINCSALAAETNVMFKFVFTCDTIVAGNNIYLDDINITSTNSIKENELENTLNLSVFPNPTNGIVNISFDLTSKHQVMLSVVDVLGKSVERLANTSLQAGSYNYSLGANTLLSRGLYFVNLSIDGNVFVKKLIVD